MLRTVDSYLLPMVLKGCCNAAASIIAEGLIYVESCSLVRIFTVPQARTPFQGDS